MQVDINWNIKIGKYKLLMLDSATITRSVEQLSDTAEIVLPGAVFNKAIEIEQKIKRDDAVLIQLGYDEDKNLVDEQGMMPADLARERRHEAVAQMIEQHQ